MGRLLDNFFKYFGMAMFVYLLIVGIHEIFHFVNAKSHNTEVKEICFLGYNFNYDSIGWVTVTNPSKEESKIDNIWDCIWYGWMIGECK